MDEKAELEAILAKAVADDAISPAQKHFYWMQYQKKKFTFAQIKAELAKKPRTKREPTVYGAYILKTCLGKGGMGEVFEAYHRQTGAKFALKKLRAIHGVSAELEENIRKRFLRECSLQSKLQHPHIVKVFDYGSQGKDLYLVTQLVDGETVQQLVEREILWADFYYARYLPILLSQTCAVCDALHYAHSQGIVHRDINPKNIMLDKGNLAWIMDFGLAKPLTPEVTKLTKSSELIGTPSYMSPEQWQGNEIGIASDIYSLGATLYFMVTGHHPQPQDPMACAYNMINQIPPLPIHTHNPVVPAPLTQIIDQAMAYSPANRFPDMKTMGQTMGRWLAEWQQQTLSQKVMAGCTRLLRVFKKPDPGTE